MGSSIHVVFLRNRLYLGHTVVTSFCMHFEKIGRGLLREGKRREGEWAVWAKRGGMNRKYLVGPPSQETGTSPPSCLLLENRLCMCPIKVNSNAIEHIVHPSF